MKHLKLFETYKAQKEIEEITSSVVKNIAVNTFDWHQSNLWTKPNKDDFNSMIDKSYRVKFKDKNNGFLDNANYVIDSYDGKKIKFKGYNNTFDINDVKLTWSEINELKFEYITPVTLADSVNYNKYDELKDFITDTHIIIKPIVRGENDINGTLVYTEGSNNMEILLYFDKSIYRELYEDKKDKIGRGSDYTSTDLYMKVFYTFHSSLLHELQHAYDAYRSGGKSFNKQHQGGYGAKQIKKELILNSKEELKEEEIEFLNDLGKQYLNFPHEINARFTQAIQKIMFSTIILDDDLESYYSEMNKWDDVYRAFKSEFEGWRHLSDKDKRRLTRKLSQFYHLDMERLEKENKKTMKKTNESAMLVAYHVTDKKNLKSILKNGLEPRVPEDFGENGDLKGIYLFKTIDDAKNALMHWMGERIEEWEEETGETYEEILLHVDITGIDCLDTVEFEWTCIEHIPADRILSVDYEV